METKAKKPEKEWKDFPAEVYEEVAAGLVHFSAKGVNSNADPCGARLATEDALPLPYVSARSLLAHGFVPQVDYTKNATQPVPLATVVRQLHELEHGASSMPPDRAEALLNLTQRARTGRHEEGTESVSPRLRQILLPKDGGYVAISPLPCGGLSQEINRRRQAHDELRDADPDLLRLTTASLGVGGANPQNVGSLVREMQTVLVFEPPKENRRLRIAYALHYRGISLNLPPKLMRAWRNWRHQAMGERGGKMPTGLEARQTEQALVLDVARAVLNAGSHAWRRLQAVRDELPGTSLLSDELDDDVVRGLVDPDSRESDWPRRFGLRIAEEIGRFSFGEKEGGIALDQSSLDQIARWVEEFVR